MSEFIYLLGGMMDITNPELTEPPSERVNRATREAHQAAVDKGSKQRTGW